MTASSLRYRALLTDTLPYEVPVIFSNSILHSSLSAPHGDPKIKSLIDLMRQRRRPFSQPYCYEIAKGNGRTTRLSIVHPAWQTLIAEFYQNHAASILNYCADERFSLRRPSAVAVPYIEGNSDEEEGRLKLGVAQLAAEAGEPDVSHLTTYFAYRKYNLLGKFADSREHQRLETRFRYRRSADISKCFYNIYTHSVTWAIKGKKYAKDQANTFTFEGQLDVLFQKINYNETNGIVVGPEFSRIFSEIILQQVDRDVVDSLSPHIDVTKSYDVRRYVDDYYIFANEIETLDVVEAGLRSCLERYKLYLNDTKGDTHSRPFVSDISLARHDLGMLLREFKRTVDEITEETEPSRIPGIMRTIRSLLSDVRLCIRKHNVQFDNVSGWLLGKYRKRIHLLLKRAIDEPKAKYALAEAVTALVESAVYICSVDLRVRTTYSLCQIAETVKENEHAIGVDQLDQIEHIVSDGIGGLIRTELAKPSNHSRDNVELYNLLICGAQFLGDDFCSQKNVSESLFRIVDSDLTYFSYITAKFCLLKNKNLSSKELIKLNKKVESYLMNASDVFEKAEDYLLLCDYLSAPDVSEGDKRVVFSKVIGGTPSKANMKTIAAHVGFVDWRGTSVKHLLKRKTLRPVYAWA